MQPRLTEVIKAVRPERALFTTFTLALGWFEAFCLPLLKLESCEQIDLLVDSREACSLGAQTASAYAGTAYRIVPVYMNKVGIFHPKIAYLKGANDDTLVVSSGNLTSPGQGGNLETIDAVNALEHPRVFEEFAQFVDVFIQRPGLSVDTVNVLKAYAQDARQAASRASREVHAAPRTVWLVHTLEQTAASQLGTLVKEQLTVVDSLTIFSPYHTPSGESIRRLARTCGTDEVRIGLQPQRVMNEKELVLIAPFDEKPKHLPNVGYVKPQGAFTKRLHAKCFEVAGESGMLLMTGSVNATLQSLCDTKNVEVALVRKLETSPFVWEDATPSRFVPCDYRAERLIEQPLSVQVSWIRSEFVGTLAPNTAERTVRLEVWSRSRMEFAVEPVDIAKDGSFEVHSDATCNTDRALRLRVLEGGSEIATGWLNVEHELSCPPYDRDLNRSASRIVGRNSSPGDLKRILDQFKRILKRAQNGIATGAASGTAAVHLDVDPHKRTGSWAPRNDRNNGLSATTAAKLLAAGFASLRNWAPVSALAGQSRAENGGDAGIERDNDDDADDGGTAKKRPSGKGPTRPPQTYREAMVEMLATLPHVLIVNATTAWMPALISMSATAVLDLGRAQANADVALSNPTPSSDPLAQAKTLRKWLADYCLFDYSIENRELLLGLFAAMAAYAAYLGGDAVDPSRLKQYVEIAALRPLSADEWLDLVAVGLETESFRAVPQEVTECVLEASLTLGDVQSTTRKLEELLRAALYLQDSRKSAEFGAHYGALHEKLRRGAMSFARTGKTERLFGVLDVNLGKPLATTRCPACNQNLDSLDMLARLSKYGAAFHDARCNKPIFVGLSIDFLKNNNIPRSLYGYQARPETSTNV